MSSKPSITVWDGHESIGGTKILLESGGQRLFLDFGTNYKTTGKYYEEFLKPRSARGIVDYFRTKPPLLPPVPGIYRPDLFAQGDRSAFGKLAGSVDPNTSVLLTHAHLDHAGAIAFLDPRIPIYCTPVTLAILRTWQETQGNLGGQAPNEMVYLGKREPEEHNDWLVRSAKGADSGRKRHRIFQLLGKAHDLPAFTSRPPGEKAWPAGARAPVTEVDRLPIPGGGGNRGWMDVDHSLFGAVGFILDADGHRIAYSGDLREAGTNEPQTKAFLAELEKKHPSLLLMEGTRLRGKDGEKQADSTEQEVHDNSLKLIEGPDYRDKLVVADFGPRNVERLLTFLDIARRTGRRLAVSTKDAYLLCAMAAADPERMKPVRFGRGEGQVSILEDPQTRGSLWRDYLDEHQQAKDAIVNPSEVTEKNRKQWLLCMSFFDANDLIDLDREATKDGLWLYSSSEAHSEEQEFDFVRLQAWIDLIGMRTVGFGLVAQAGGRPGELEPFFDDPKDRGYHSSGHATEDQLVAMVRRIEPAVMVPLHTTNGRRYEKLLKDAGLKTRVERVTLGKPISW